VQYDIMSQLNFLMFHRREKYYQTISLNIKAFLPVAIYKLSSLEAIITL